ncbi:MAG: hypothetical protein KatS3mg105_4109 [Gemmatales bacterium]|nr:MAG: hypothetical protein KatS3mg105_4109 [Gemmatales bacterium]
MKDLHTVHIRVNDADTGKPTPVRIAFYDSEGNYYAPFGRLANFSTKDHIDVGGNVLWDNKKFAYIDGTCEIRLPAGRLLVQISKGPEYKPIVEDVSLPAGKLALRFNIERFSHRRDEGWYAGDARAHALTPHAAWLEAAAEDLAVANLLARPIPLNGCRAIPNIIAFSGQSPLLDADGHLVVVNTLNRHPFLGALALLNCHRAVYPLEFGGPDGADDWSLADWCDQCHRKGGLVVWTPAEHDPSRFRFGEPLADLALGKVDAFEIAGLSPSSLAALETWQHLLQAGLRVPLAGASGKQNNQTLLGSLRTWARLLPDQEFNYRHWIEAVRAGRTFISNGPFIDFTANGLDPGSELCVQQGETVAIRVRVESPIPFDRVEAVANAEVIASASAGDSPCSAELTFDWRPTSSAWLAARCTSSAVDSFTRGFAHTSPIYVQVQDGPFVPDRHAVAKLRSELEALLGWAQSEARCPTDRQRQNLCEIFREALAKLV